MSIKENIFNSNKEIIQLINKYDDVFSKFGVFKFLDYDLNLDERIMKFKKYGHVICEDCNQEIEKFSFLCYSCYNKETDCNEHNHMNYGICKFCFKSNTSHGCSTCKIFVSSDYDLISLEERITKYKSYDYISCKECNRSINKPNYYCTYCYNKEINSNRRNRMKYGPKFGIFNTSDYELNLEERKAKYKKFYYIICEECNNEFGRYYPYCTYCYIKETDINKKGSMKYGPNFGIFNTSDYDLNFKGRKVKYGDFDGILCEKCNGIIVYWYYYCTDCYKEETDINKKRCMKYGPNFGIFNTSDYDLNLEERKAKYKGFNAILCEECNREIGKSSYCVNCYRKETDINKRGRMEYGDDILCEECNQEIGKSYFYCVECYSKKTDINKKRCMKYGSNFGIFNISDYDLNFKEKKVKYGDLDAILCERCNGIIDHRYYYCTFCYSKETDINKKRCMKYGSKLSKLGIFDTSDYDLNLKKRKIKYDAILCEKCYGIIDHWYNYCTDCYKEETDVINSRMKYGSNFVIGIFKESDYNLNTKEREAKYKEFDGILCEKCNKGIYNWNFYCTFCYNEEADINKKNYMKYGSNFEICNILDYNLNLEEREAKYKDYDYILCEKCYTDIDKEYHYCTSCYRSSNISIFRTLDYNLKLEEKQAKYEEYDHIFCEKCNKEIYKSYYYCEHCYNEETDMNKNNYMIYGSNFEIFNTLDYNLNLKERKAKYKYYDYILCEKCYRKLEKKYYCSDCYRSSKISIFKTSDHNLKLEEKKAKYEEYDDILCEKCYRNIDKEYYSCKYCHNRMTNSGCKVCFIRNNDDCCSFYEFQQFLENFNKWISENKFFDDYSIKEQKGEVSDYDLDEDDKRVKYKNFDYILCEKCGIKYHYNHCYDCYVKEINELNELKSRLQPKLQDYENFYSEVYNKETKELKELKELQSILKDYKNVYFRLDGVFGIFKQIIQQFEATKNKIEYRKTLIKNIRHHGVNKCERELRSYCDCYDREIDINEKKRMEFGKCKECLKIHEDLYGCLSCNSKCFQINFDKWTSRNKVIDKLIQDNQLTLRKYGLLEWIPHNKFTNIKYIAKGGFAKVYSATWSDGQIRKWSQFSNNWKRNGSTKIALKVLNNSKNISEDFLNEIKFINEVSDPITCNYALVLQYMDNGDLRKYLERTANVIAWDQRLNKIYDICLALNNIHFHGLIHKDLHPGNIFIDSTFAHIGDFGFCMPANENSTKKNIYGVMPYIAPEILRGKSHTLASDVYSLGVIINEIITVIPPFNNQPHDHYLVLDICRGLRPNIRAETPDSLKELIEKCWDANPEDRPTSKEILYLLSNKLSEYKNMPLKLSYNLNESNELQSHPLATYTSRLLNFQNLPEPINCSNQQEFISSRYIKKIQTGQVNILHSDECSDCIINYRN